MGLNPSAGLFTDAFFDGLSRSVEDVETAETLPPSCYTDADFYAFEKEALFNHEWLCVGRVDWVKEQGDFFTTTIIGEPIIVTRNRNDEIKAMSAVCQHRAMLVAEGRGNTRGFVCPYHHWVYSLNGDLVNAPAMERTCDFNKKAIKLPTFKVEIWLGFIFINFDEAAPPLAPRLTAVETAIANFDLGRRGSDAADDRPVRLELEGDVREQQRRLPRQQAAPRSAARLHSQRAMQLSGGGRGRRRLPAVQRNHSCGRQLQPDPEGGAAGLSEADRTRIATAPPSPTFRQRCRW
jgi:nitrite reductase/ring-hydroxylating ferredoxin subunit